MNQEELVGIIVKETGLNKKITTKILRSILDVVIETVARGDSITLVEFGRFETRHRQAKINCLNRGSLKHQNKISSPEFFNNPAKNVPHFQPSKIGFKSRLNGIARPKLGGQTNWKAALNKPAKIKKEPSVQEQILQKARLGL